MALDIPQPALKRNLISLVDECSDPLDPSSLSSYSKQISNVKMDNQTTNPPSPTSSLTMATTTTIASSTPPQSHLSTDHVAPIQPPLKKMKLLSKDTNIKGSQNYNKAEEKRRKEKVKEAEREKKEADRKKKEAEREEKRAAQEIERQAKEEKRRKIEEEKKRKEEERERKERNQLKLKSFFAAPTPASTPPAQHIDTKGCNQNIDGTSTMDKNVTSSMLATNSAELQPTPYYKLFPEFFIQSGVTLAPCSRFEKNKDKLKRVQENLDLCLNEAFIMDRKPDKLCDMLNLSHHNTVPRGKVFKSVRLLMEDFYSGKSTGLRDDSKSSVLGHNPLHRIPMKHLKFYEDVRPPYVGTYTCLPIGGTLKLARNPLRKNLPNKNYDYDSEAEWVEDEDGEEIKSDEEEEELDDDEDIDEFLDDENDELVNSRHIEINGDLEPISTGLCWEDENRHNPNVEMAMYRMEFILDLNMNSINPFLTSYWAPRSSETPAPPLASVVENKSLVNKRPIILPALRSDKPFLSSNSSNCFSSFSQVTTSLGKCKNKEFSQTKLLPAEDMEDFKTAIVGSDLSKVGLIEVLKRKFPGRPAAVIKATLEVIAQRGQKGQKESEKRWFLV